jgi:hypothetical protein
VRETNLVVTVLNENQDNPGNQKTQRKQGLLKTNQAMRNQEVTVRNAVEEAEETLAIAVRKATRMEATNLLPIRPHENPVFFSSLCVHA